jgi:hypothetical protein
MKYEWEAGGYEKVSAMPGHGGGAIVVENYL